MSESTQAQIEQLAAFRRSCASSCRVRARPSCATGRATAEWSILEIIGHMIDVGASGPSHTPDAGE